MHFDIIPAVELSLAEQARVLNAAFANYVAGWHDLEAESLARFLCLQGSDLCVSRFIRAEQKLAGFGYLNRTGDILRISGMGIVPEARGSGAANCLLEHLLGEAETRGEQTMMLEVIQQNPRAVALYRRHNFREIGELFGWRRKANSILANEPRSSFEEIPILDALRRPMVAEYPVIPWQISRHALREGRAHPCLRGRRRLCGDQRSGCRADPDSRVDGPP